MRSRDGVAMLLTSALMASAWPAPAAEECVAGTIDQVGRCGGGRGFARATVDRELRGIDAPRPSPPPGLDPDLLAVQLGGGFAVGELYPVDGGDGEWVLVAREAEVVAESGNRYALRERGYPTRTSLVALLSWHEGEDGTALPTVRVLATAPGLVDGTAADAGAASVGEGPPPLRPTVPCVDPEGGDAGLGAGYPDVAGEFRWLRLSPQHRVLAAVVSRSEGYAGGGGSFVGEVLLEPRQGRLAPVACHARSRYQMFGGDWNPDGTRQHPESQAAWTLQVVPGGAWPQLRLKPRTADTPGARLRWDPAAGHYIGD